MPFCGYKSHREYAEHLIISKRIILQFILWCLHVSSDKETSLPYTVIPIASSTENPVSHENNQCQIPGDWGRACPLGTLEGRGFLGQLLLTSGLSRPHMGWTKVMESQQVHPTAASAAHWSPESLHPDVRLRHLWPQSHLHDEAPSHLCSLNRHRETDVHFTQHNPLGNSAWQRQWQTSGETTPWGPSRSTGTASDSNSISSWMLSWLTDSITVQVKAQGGLIQSLRDAAGLFPSLPTDCPLLGVNHTP